MSEAVPNEEVKNYLFASDLFLFSSRSETQGIVLAEAMAAGLPAAAVEAYGVNDIVRDKYNGLLCEESVDAFAENMKKLITDRKLYENYRKGRCRQHIFTAKKKWQRKRKKDICLHKNM